MDNYREKLKFGNIVIAITIIVLALSSILALLAEMGLVPFFLPTAGDGHWQSMWRGFISGASFSIMALLILSLFRNLAALKDERKLKKLYIKEHDERSIQVWTCARAAGLQAFLLLGLAAVIVSGYFNAIVSVTILGCVFFASIISVLFKLYYSKKF